MAANSEIRKEIKRLKKEKEEWVAKTFSASALKKAYKLTDSEIRKIKLTRNYGVERYTNENIAEYFKQKEKFI